ncbi:MAG: TonB-dependent receptor domain-containing protein, partial [Psychrobacter sp.]
IGGQNNMTNQLRDSANFNASDRQTTDNNFDITALARYDIDSQKNLALGLSHKERTPSLYERYTWSTWKMAAIMNNTVGDGNGYFGDPNLRPEKSNTLSATLDWRGADDSWGVKATPYYSKIDDYVDAIQWNPMANTAASTQTANQYNVLRYTNQDAEIYGIDISANRELAANAWGYWNMVGSLSYTKGKNKDSGSDLYNIMPFNGSVALNRENNGWTNQIEVVGVAAKNDISTPRNEIKTAGYGLLNLSTGYQFKEVAIEAGIDNVFDKNYALPLGGAYMGQGKTMSMNGEIGNGSNWGTAVPGAGRSLYVGVNYKF